MTINQSRSIEYRRNIVSNIILSAYMYGRVFKYSLKWLVQLILRWLEMEENYNSPNLIHSFFLVLLSEPLASHGEALLIFDVRQRRGELYLNVWTKKNNFWLTRDSIPHGAPFIALIMFPRLVHRSHFNNTWVVGIQEGGAAHWPALYWR